MKDTLTICLILLLFPFTSFADIRVSDFNNDIHAAYDALPQRGGVLILDADTYQLNRQLIINKRTTIRGEGCTQSVGEGAPTTIIKSAEVQGAAIVVNIDGVVLDNFYLRGESGNTGNGITVENARFTGRNLTISHMGGNGLRMGGDQSQNCNYWRLDNIYLSANGTYGAFFWSRSWDVNAGVGTMIVARDNAMGGIVIGQAIGNVFNSLNASNNDDAGIRFMDGARGNVVYGGNVEQNNGHQIILMDGSTGNEIFHMRVDEWADYGIKNKVTNGVDID